MSEKKNRWAISLDDESVDLLKIGSSLAGIPVAGIITRFLSAHCEELTEWIHWMEVQEKGSRRYEFGKNLLVSYGPGTLIEEIRQIDPTYKFLSEQFRESVTGDLAGGDK